MTTQEVQRIEAEEKRAAPTDSAPQGSVSATVPSRSPRNIGSLFKSLIMVGAIILAAGLAIRPMAVPPAGSAAPDGFSGARALEDLRVITAAPRVPGSDGYQAALDYLVAELEAMGLEPEVTETLSVQSGEGGAAIGRAQNIVARIPGADSTGAVLLGGHLDTVHTTVEASDW